MLVEDIDVSVNIYSCDYGYVGIDGKIVNVAQKGVGEVKSRNAIAAGVKIQYIGVDLCIKAEVWSRDHG